MNLITQYMTRNDCYTAMRKITPRGIMVHSTASPGVMAASWFSRWNKSYKAGETDRKVCVQAFVDDTGVWQYLPWNHCGWHSGGRANDTHIGFEICEPAGFKYGTGSVMIGYDPAKQEAYFRKAWDNAVALCVLLCHEYGLNETHIICHSEGYKKGIASNHSDVMHWFVKHGESMDTFRAAVKKALADANPEKPVQVQFYRVRKSWVDSSSQKGAYRNLDYAKSCADKNPGYSVYDNEGHAVYTSKTPGTPDYITYVASKSDTLWSIARKMLGSGERYLEIKALNGLTSDVIQGGQVLKLPR